MDKPKMIEERIQKAFVKLSEKFSIPIADVSVAIIYKESGEIAYAVYERGSFKSNIALSDVADLSLMGIPMVGEKTVVDNIKNKFYLFSIPIKAQPSELRVLIKRSPNGTPQGFLYKKNELLNDTGFRIGSLFG